jgi:hypothetical protein
MTESVGADILLEAHRLVTGPRNDTYGNVVDDYSKVIHIFEGLTGIKLSLVRRAALHGVSQDGTTAHEPRPQPTAPRQPARRARLPRLTQPGIQRPAIPAHRGRTMKARLCSCLPTRVLPAKPVCGEKLDDDDE